jgi:transcriptional regulator with XRE-family HTH domain
MQTLKHRFFEVRKAHGLKQQEFADRIGLTQAAVSQFETGERFPSVESIWAVHKAFGTELDYLIYEVAADANA